MSALQQRRFPNLGDIRQMYQYDKTEMRSDNCRFAQYLIAICIVFLGISQPAWSVELYSVHVDREGEKVVVKGSGLDAVTTVTLGGISVPISIITAAELEVPFGSEVYSAVQWEASYNLVIDGSIRISVYIDNPILAPSIGGPDCPCISGWEASTIPIALCLEGIDNTPPYTQSYIIASWASGAIASAFDPNHIIFDAENPGNSISYCALADNGSYVVAEPVVNQDQYSDCNNWIRSNICLFP
ncbi:MAG: hypothetical protein HRT93_09710 [Piscirickettsiaceae bacterium]|nr:hypothetical protein [Piscirickettsiaceae bacterium]